MKIGFIGCGNMASAMIRGILDSKIVKNREICASAKSDHTRKRIKEELQILCAEDNRAVAAFADVLFLAVKPQYYEEVLREIGDTLTEEKILVSMAPGKTIAWMEERLGMGTKIIRIMPNTPATVKAGMTGMCKNSFVSEEELQAVEKICESFGRARILREELLDVVVGVSGSAPAYVFIFIEALADAAVAEGMPRKLAYEFSAQAVLGGAKMVLETGVHPAQLKDQVCSPGGTTIEAVRVLEEKGMRSAVMEAACACIEKGREM